MTRRSYRGKKFKPKRANGAIGLKFNKVYRCDKCGTQHKQKPAQCICGHMAFTFFDSSAEASRYSTLLLFEERNVISNLRRQVRIPLNTRGPDGLMKKIGLYIADFEYEDEDGKRVIEDVKGLITDLADWKIRHVKAEYGITVKLTR